jgi:hypothetical protein
MGLLSTNTISGLASAISSKSGAKEIEELIGGSNGAGGGENILLHGASTVAGFDNGPALSRAILAAAQKGTYHVHIPGGTFEIYTGNCLHPATAGITATDGLSAASGSSGRGIRFTGDAQNYSILKLMHSAGETLWLYDSQSSPGWSRAQFEHIWFQTDQETDAELATLSETNGFRIWATAATGSVDKGFVFYCCRFDYFGIPQTFVGETNADSCNHYSCWYNGCGPIVINNDQSLCHTWYSCHFYVSFGLLSLLATDGGNDRGGGGATAFRDCDIIQFNLDGDTDDHYTVTMEDNCAYARVLLFDQCRWEFRNPESKLLYLPGTGANSTSHSIVFNSCDLSIAQQSQSGIGGGGSDTNGIRVMMKIGVNKRVVFNDSWLLSQLAITFQDVNSGTLTGFAYQGTVEFNRCGLPHRFIHAVDSAGTAADAAQGLTNRITLSSSFGRVVARQCFGTTTGLSESFTSDFDYGGIICRQEAAKESVRVCRIKADNQTFPIASQTTRARRVPPGSIIKGAYLYEPASGSSATAKQTLICHKAQSVTNAIQKPADTEVRLTIVGHGLVNGDRVFVTSVGGTTEANGIWTVEGVATDTFELTGSTWVNAYTSGGTVYRVLAESSSDRSDALHKATVNLTTASTPFPFTVSSFADTKFWLLATAGTLATKTGGYAYVEYE